MTTYLLDDAGRIYRAADMATIPPDPDNTEYQKYQAWITAGNAAGAAPVSQDYLRNYASQKYGERIAAGITINVAAAGQPAVDVICDGTADTKADLKVLYDLVVSGQLTAGTWRDNHWAATTLTGAQFQALGLAITAWCANMVAACGALHDQIAAGTITSKAQIDAFAWPTA
jgi:hypothetical protein